jgi:alanine-glyoxylate transaminase/serine-glyoxylate transaminase/serine-pyruvate transaminase
MSQPRMPGRNFLFVPGPTNVPDRVIRAMMVAMEDHRSSKFPELTLWLFQETKKVFKTEKGQVFIFPSSGTGAWEAALSNTLSRGDKVLVPRFGQFSHLWIDLAQRIGLDVLIQDEEWGTGASPDRIEQALRADRTHSIKAVLVVHNETATGVTSDIAAVRRAIDAARHPAMLYVDGVSSIASIDFRMDDWQVDLAITGSQKGLMLPAGLGIVCASPKALAAHKSASCTRAYFDFSDHIKANATGYFPYTPSLPMLYGLRESLNILFEERLSRVFERHQVLAEGVRAAVKAWDLRLCAKEPKWYSNTVSAVMVPSRINGAEVIDVAFRRYNLALGAGLAQVAGKLFRIGHLGDLNDLMVLGALAGAEMAMRDVGIDVKLGSGLAAAQAHFGQLSWPRRGSPQNRNVLPRRTPKGLSTLKVRHRKPWPITTTHGRPLIRVLALKQGLGGATRSTRHGSFLSHCGPLHTDKLQAHFFKKLALLRVIWFLLLQERVV